MKLINLALHHKAFVLRLEQVPPKRRNRLYEVGVVPGTEIQKLFAPPFQAPCLYYFRGSVFAFDRETAGKILVRELGDGN